MDISRLAIVCQQLVDHAREEKGLYNATDPKPYQIDLPLQKFLDLIDEIDDILHNRINPQ